MEEIQVIENNKESGKKKLLFPSGFLWGVATSSYQIEIEKALGKILKKLKTNGILMISIPLKNTLLGKIFHKFDIDKTHVSVPSRKFLFNLLKKYDLEILDKRYFLNVGYFKICGMPVDVELVLRKNKCF